MEGTKKGRATYHAGGGFEFRPFNEGKPESKNWLTLKENVNGKIECSKNRARMVITLNRCDVDNVCPAFINTAFELSALFTKDKKAQARYNLAATMKPWEITYDDDVPTHG